MHTLHSRLRSLFSRRTHAFTAALAALGVSAGVATAQGQMGGMGGGMGGMPSAPMEEKKDGVAEAAPKAPTQLPATPILPMPKSKRKKWKLLEMDGYFRLRTDWFKNFHLGFADDATRGGAPFPTPLGCTEDRCTNTDSMSGANMRLRLEPTINLDEGTSVHLQLDVLDNLVLGSTPYGEVIGSYNDGSTRPPGSVLGDTQSPAVRGRNTDRDAIIVKQVWAEVAIPMGLLKFGRMPNHWGMGILNNGGTADPFHGTYDMDANTGDTVDRISFSTLIPGTNLRAALASDWSITRLVSNQTSAGQGRESHPFDLDDEDDANQWLVTVSKLETPSEFQDTLDRGSLAYNYGFYMGYRTQARDNDLTGATLGGTLDAARYVAREATIYTPDAWGRVAYGEHELEAEVAGKIGSLYTADAQGNTNKLDVRMYGGAARYRWRGLDRTLILGVEGGAASGDTWDNSPAGRVHYTNAQGLGGAGDTKLTQFMFSPTYRVDEILYRHLMGTVTNSAYAKPFVAYQLTSSISARVQNVTAFAMKAEAMPGNSRLIGTEFDADLAYRNGGFYAGISYGLLFPLDGLAHPVSSGLDLGFGTNTGTASAAHSINSRLVLSF